MENINEKYRNRKKAIEAALNFCTQNELEKFILIEKEFFTKNFLKERISSNKEEFLYYALRNLAHDMVGYLLKNGCELSINRYRSLILDIQSKRLVKLYDLLVLYNLMNKEIFEFILLKLFNREYYLDIEEIFIKYYGSFSFFDLKNKLKDLGIDLKNSKKHTLFFRNLSLEELLKD